MLTIYKNLHTALLAVPSCIKSHKGSVKNFEFRNLISRSLVNFCISIVIRNVKFMKKLKAHNVYHRCLRSSLFDLPSALTC